MLFELPIPHSVINEICNRPGDDRACGFKKHVLQTHKIFNASI